MSYLSEIDEKYLEIRSLTFEERKLVFGRLLDEIKLLTGVEIEYGCGCCGAGEYNDLIYKQSNN